jgi:hypothetical protein
MEALAAAAISIVAPYIVKGADVFAKEAGTAAFNAVSALAKRLQGWWSDKPVANAAVQELASDPETYSKTLTQLLASDLAQDESFAAELQQLVESVAPHVHVVQRMEVAQGVTGADIDELIKGTVDVQQEMKQAEDVIGFSARKVGGG